MLFSAGIKTVQLSREFKNFARNEGCVYRFDVEAEAMLSFQKKIRKRRP
jgi:hypothetical protein